jgi:hypothetical protein
MTDLRQRLADVLGEKLTAICDADYARWADHLADVLLSLPGIAIVDLAHIDPIAEAIAKNWPDTYAESWPWSDIPESAREGYRKAARAAVLAAADKAEQGSTHG